MLNIRKLLAMITLSTRMHSSRMRTARLCNVPGGGEGRGGREGGVVTRSHIHGWGGVLSPGPMSMSGGREGGVVTRLPGSMSMSGGGGGREGGGCCHQVPCPCPAGGGGREGGGVVTRSHVYVWGGREGGVVTRSHVHVRGGGEGGGCCDQDPCPCLGGG